MSSHAEILRLAEQSLRAGDLPKAEALYRQLLSELDSTLAISCWNQRKLAPAETAERFRVAAFCRASDIDSLTQLRSSLRERMRLSPLCDGAAFTPEARGGISRDVAEVVRGPALMTALHESRSAVSCSRRIT